MIDGVALRGSSHLDTAYRGLICKSPHTFHLSYALTPLPCSFLRFRICGVSGSAVQMAGGCCPECHAAAARDGC